MIALCRSFALPAAALLLAACAGKAPIREPAPGDPGYAFNVSGTYTGMISVEGQTIPATMVLETGREGVVTGEVRVAEMGITAPVEGTLSGDQFTLNIGYFNPGSGCNGAARSTATVEQGGGAFSGGMSISECGQSMSGALRFRRQ